MKNHLKRHPYLRFVDAPAAETGGDAPAAQASPAAAAEDTAPQVDWEAEARAAAMEAEAMRAKVAAATGVDDPSGARPAAVSTPGPR